MHVFLLFVSVKKDNSRSIQQEVYGEEIILRGITNKYALKACLTLFGHMTAVNSYIFNFIFLILSSEFIFLEQ